MHKLLCWLGLHHWMDQEVDTTGWVRDITVWKCSICGKKADSGYMSVRD